MTATPLQKYLRLQGEGMSSQQAARRTMPTIQAITQHWDGRLLAMDRDVHGSGCFACGSTRRLHRAHIKPVSKFKPWEFPNELDNLHVLCELCHSDSEMLEESDYWTWFRQTSMFSRKAVDIFSLCPELAEAAFFHLLSSDPQRFARLAAPALPNLAVGAA